MFGSRLLNRHSLRVARWVVAGALLLGLSAQVLAVPPGAQNSRRILVEQFTQNSCGACPGGDAKLQQLREQYGAEVVRVDLHRSDQYGTQLAAELMLEFSVFGYPSVLYDRVSGPHNQTNYLPEWPARYDDPQPLDITFTSTYQPSTRKVGIVTTTHVHSSHAGENRVNCYVMEDHLISNQNTHGDPIPDYDHRYVLRAGLGGMLGSGGSLPQGGLLAGDEHQYVYNYTLDPEVDPSNVWIACFVAEVYYTQSSRGPQPRPGEVLDANLGALGAKSLDSAMSWDNFETGDTTEWDG